jgi:hypothetical protein
MSGLSSQPSYRYAISKANEIKGLHNLRQIHTVLQAQCITGGYPETAT